VASPRVPLANNNIIHKTATYDILKIFPPCVPLTWKQEAVAHVAASSRLEACSLLINICILAG